MAARFAGLHSTAGGEAATQEQTMVRVTVSLQAGPERYTSPQISGSSVPAVACGALGCEIRSGQRPLTVLHALHVPLSSGTRCSSALGWHPRYLPLLQHRRRRLASAVSPGVDVISASLSGSCLHRVSLP